MKLLLFVALALLAGCATLGSQQSIDHILTNLDGCDRDYQGSVSSGTGIGVPPVTIVVHINCKAHAVVANGDALPAPQAPAAAPVAVPVPAPVPASPAAPPGQLPPPATKPPGA